MAFQEYPKALYRAGDCKTVHDEDDEHAARAEGFDDWQNDQAAIAATTAAEAEAIEATPTLEQLREAAAHLHEREADLQAKEHDLAAREEAVSAREQAVADALAAAAAAPAVTEAPAASDEPPTRDELKAQAAALGIDHAPNISTEKLAALVASHVKAG